MSFIRWQDLNSLLVLVLPFWRVLELDHHYREKIIVYIFIHVSSVYIYYTYIFVKNKIKYRGWILKPDTINVGGVNSRRRPPLSLRCSKVEVQLDWAVIVIGYFHAPLTLTDITVPAKDISHSWTSHTCMNRGLSHAWSWCSFCSLLTAIFFIVWSYMLPVYV